MDLTKDGEAKGYDEALQLQRCYKTVATDTKVVCKMWMLLGSSENLENSVKCHLGDRNEWLGFKRAEKELIIFSLFFSDKMSWKIISLP